MKKITLIVLSFLVLLCLSVSVSAVENPLLIDNADLLTDEQEAALLSQLQRVSDAYGSQVSLVTMPETQGNIDALAENFYDENGCGSGENRSGVLLFVSMNPRNYSVFANEDAWIAIDTDSVADAILADMKANHFASAFDTYVAECEFYLDCYVNGTPFEFGFSLLVSLGIGLVVALIYCGILKGQLKSVRSRNEASNYVRPGSMQLTQSGDYFMYRNIVRTEKPQNNSSSSGSGGSSRGSSSRSF